MTFGDGPDEGYQMTGPGQQGPPAVPGSASSPPQEMATPRPQTDVSSLAQARALHLLHTSDLHGHVQAMAYLATVVKQERAKHPDALLLDCGDWALGSQISDLFQGKPMIEIMNEIGYTAAGIGEGDLAWGLDVLLQRVAEARFPILAANLVGAGGRPLPGIRPHHVVESGGNRVGLIGVCCQECERPGQVRVLDPREVVLESIFTLRASDVDTFVVLSHLGQDGDRALAAAVPGMHCILGGHSHVTLPAPEQVGETMIACAGKDAEFVGAITLSFGTAAEAMIRATGHAPDQPAGGPSTSTGGTTP